MSVIESKLDAKEMAKGKDSKKKGEPKEEKKDDLLVIDDEEENESDDEDIPMQSYIAENPHPGDPTYAVRMCSSHYQKEPLRRVVIDQEDEDVIKMNNM